MIQRNLEAVRNRIKEVCGKIGRDPQTVQLVAVSKTFGIDEIGKAVEAGQIDFGENYVQEMVRKMDAYAGKGLRWHLIGHVQTNKVRHIVNAVHLIHSLDSIRLAEEINKRAVNPVDVLVEVHTTDEATKSGVRPADAVQLVRDISDLERIRIRGLMTMGPFSDDPNDSRPSFQALARLKREIEEQGLKGVTMEHLSMGMSHDFEIGIEEGATLVRIGTAIFGERAKDR